MHLRKILSIPCIFFVCLVAAEFAQPVRGLFQQAASRPPSLMENLGRGVVAVRTGATSVFVSWRLLGTDSPDTAFNLYRSTSGGAAVLLNATPLTQPTHFVDSTADLTRANAYFVRPIAFGLEQAASASFTLAADAPVRSYLRVPLQQPPGGTTPAVETYTHTPNDCSVGDLDGDGEYEIVVKWEPTNAKDNSQSGYTGNVFLDGYKIDGTRLWRIDLGRNIRAGAHYTQFQVFDLDGDGKAEVACKTADGTIDGVGTVIGNAAADYRNSGGYILSGPEYLTVFNGQTGAAMATTEYVVPRGTVSSWGDNYGNRVDRFLAAVAYLDGQRPSLVMCRGYYTRVVVAAWNWRNGALTNVWTFDTGHTGTSNQYAAWRGQGNHNLSIGDVDGDGKDEIMYGAAAIDDDGRGLFSTGWGHGDALHMTDMDPDRPGMEVFQPHESPSSYGPNAAEFRDARTGALIWGVQASGDIGRGLALDVDPRYRGYEMWASGGTGGMYTAQQSTPNVTLGPRAIQIASGKPSINFGVWWDGDLLRELLDGTTISKWNWLTGTTSSLLSDTGIASNNSTKATPNLSADLLGDWREEVIWRETASPALRIYLSTIPTSHRFFTLMHDRQYREAIAWQNTGYNQPPHPSFFLGDGMAAPPEPNIVTSLGTLLGPAAPVFTGIENDAGASANDFITNDSTLLLHGTAAPNTTVTVTRFGVGVIGTAIANASGAWSLDYRGTALPEGDALFTAVATDANNQSGPQTSPPFRVRVDLSAPNAPTLQDISGTGTLTFTGTAEAGSTVNVTREGAGVIGTTVANAAGAWTLNFEASSLSAGSYSFRAAATDVAGNTGAASAASTIDTRIATPVITGITDDTGGSAADGVTADKTLLISGTATAGHSITVKQRGGATLGAVTADAGGQWSLDATSTALADGLYELSASATSAGGTSPSSAAFAVRVDTRAPAVTSVNRQNPTAGSGAGAAITFRVRFDEAVINVDAGDFTPVFSSGLSGPVSEVQSAGDGIFDVTVGPLSGEGTVRLDVNAAGTAIADVAGNALTGGYTAGQVFTRSLTGNGTWIQNLSGGLWGANLNWFAGIVGAGVGATTDFSTLELVDDVLVRLDSPRTIGNLLFGDSDPASPGGWRVDNNGNPANALTLSVVAGTPTVTVNALGTGAETVLDVSLNGTQGLVKGGLGPLVLTRLSTLTGGLAVNGGLLRLANGSSLNIGNNAVNLASGTQFNLAGGAFTTAGLVTAVTSAFVVDSGTASLGSFRTNSDFSGTLRVNGGQLTVGNVDIRRNSAATADFGSGFIIAGGTATAASVGLGTANSTGAMSIQGGSLLVTGPVTIGNQTSGGRGGAMRVLSGAFTSTDAVDGVVLSRRQGTNANNVASATFSGGLSTVEKFTLGYDSTVTAGSATLTLNGGALYLGSGGIVKNGAAGLATNLAFGGGLLGAKADWSTSLPITLPAGGDLIVKAADATDVPRSITLAGPIAGAGAISKTGGGRLTLGGANTFSGPLAVNAGLLDLTGTLGAGADLSINAGGALTGSGGIDRNVALNAGGALIPGPTLTATSLTWSGGGAMGFELGASSNRVAMTGALTKGSAGPRQIVFAPVAGFAAGNVYTLATFASTDLTPADLVFSGLPAGFIGELTVTPTSLLFEVFGPPVIAAQPQSVIALMGGSATFSVTVNRSLDLSYQWFKDGDPIAGASGPSLTINNVQASDTGSYSVVISNGAGSVTSNAASLSIAAVALVRQASVGGVVEGSLQQMLGQNFTLNGNASISGDLRVPGTPRVILNGQPAFGGTIDGAGSEMPDNYAITLNSGATLGRVVRRTDPVPLPAVSAPPAPAGTRNVILNNPNESPGDWTTLRNLTLNGAAGQIAVPAGAYGDFTANGASAGFTLGIAGATVPSAYSFQRVTLNGASQLRIAGPVILTVANGFNVNGLIGNAANPAWLTLRIFAGDLTLNGAAQVHGYVSAPAGTVIINGGARLSGGLASDRLLLNGNGRLSLLIPPNPGV